MLHFIQVLEVISSVVPSIFPLLLKVLNRIKKDGEETKKHSIHIILKSKNPNRKLRESNRTHLGSKPYLEPYKVFHEEIIIYKDKKTEFTIVRRTTKVKDIKD